MSEDCDSAAAAAACSIAVSGASAGRVGAAPGRVIWLTMPQVRVPNISFTQVLGVVVKDLRSMHTFTRNSPQVPAPERPA